MEILPKNSLVSLQPKLVNSEQYFLPGVEPIAEKSWELVHHLPKTQDEAG